MAADDFCHNFRIILPHILNCAGAYCMSDAKPLYRTTLPNGMEVAYVDKGTKNPLGLTRELYEKGGYSPAFDDLPQK
jgi:hypothetical protein